MNYYDVLRETATQLELVRVIPAETLEEAKAKAKSLGYDKSYRVEESYEE